MAEFTVEEIRNNKAWEGFILSHKPQTFLQSWAWGEVNRATGSKIFRLGFRKHGKLVGTCLLIEEKAKRGPHFLVPAGPIIDWGDKGFVIFFIRSIKELARKEKVCFVRIRPELLDSSENRSLFARLGFIPAPMHLHAENTWILDISKSEAEILSGMRKTTRYLIRKGVNSNLGIQISKDPKFAALLYKLQEETAERHGFVGFQKELFKEEIKIFGSNNCASVFVCTISKKPLAAAIIIFYGDTAYYHFSGSVSDFSKVPFSYFLQWEVIKEARKRGIKYYNFWGIAPNDNPKHRFAGVTLFKTGFGGRRVDWLHARDLPISPKYYLTYIFETGRRIFRRL